MTQAKQFTQQNTKVRVT